MSADELKAAGNALLAAKDFDGAIEKFTQAIALAPENHILFSNRSAAFASQKQWDKALEDAEKVTEIKPDWPKGWGRKGAALHGQGDLSAAKEAYTKGLEVEPGNAQNAAGLKAVEKALENESGGNRDNALAGMFNDPTLLTKLAANPKTSKFLADPSFMAKLNMIRQNAAGSQEIFSDPRFIQVMGVMMGVDMDMMSGGMGGDVPRGEAEEDVSMPDVRPSSTRPQKAPEPEPEPEPEDEEAIAKKKAKAEADEEKAKGTVEYKKRNFDAAIAHYQKAWDTHKDIAYLNNLGAANFEKGDYDAAIQACEKAVQEGREIYADFKMIAKSYARIGSSYERLGDYTKAIEHYQKSLTEHRTPDTINKLRAAEKFKIESTKQAYIDPEKAEEARELGNAKFKESDWPGAVAAYTEMTKRAPEDPRGYSNRAAAFIKLLEFPSAVDDCDQAIKRDGAFIRAYLRKAQAYFGMRDYSKCVDVCEEAVAKDVTGANRREIEQQSQKALQAMYSSRADETEEQTKERIGRDPEIQSIMSDPIMQSILQQAQGDPAALQEHMKNPGIRSKVQKLIAAGVIRVGR